LLDLRPEELQRAEQLMYKAKYQKALEIIKTFEKKETLSSKEQISALILKGKIYNYCGNYKEAVEIGELVYHMSQKQGTISECIDALLIKSYVVFLGKLEKAFDHILEAEKLLKSISDDSSISFSRLQADFFQMKSVIYYLKDDLNNALELAIQCLALQENKGEKLNVSLAYETISNIYNAKGEYDEALDYIMKSLTIQEELNNQIGVATCLASLAIIHHNRGDLDQALKFSRQSLMIDEIDILTKVSTLHILGSIYKEKGELDRALRHYNRAARLAEKNDHTEEFITHLMGIGATYRMKGDYKKAIENLKRSLKLSEDSGFLMGMSASLFYLVLISLDNNSLEQAKTYLTQLEEHSLQIESKIFNQAYLIAKALVLRKAGRIRNYTEAEMLLKEIIETGQLPPTFYLLSLVNLCDLFLEELYLTNNPEVLEEINIFITKVLEMAKNSNSYLWLAETKLLQAKLALIQMNFDKAKKLLIHAQQIAEMHGFNLLAIKISSEHDNLLEKLNTWEILKKTNAPISERIKLASFEEVINRMQGKGSVESPKLSPEVSVLLLIIGEGGFPLFSNQFTKKQIFEDNLISSFLTAFNTFSRELFSKGLDRAKFGEYMLLMQSVGIYSVCYLYKGPTYLAKQKLTQFTDKIQNTTSIWHTLNKFYKTNRIVEFKDLPALETLITEIFLV
jgi:tetratricopeptide (TPR) repeat protein